MGGWDIPFAGLEPCRTTDWFRGRQHKKYYCYGNETATTKEEGTESRLLLPAPQQQQEADEAPSCTLRLLLLPTAII
jgi:hypothetical protein